VMMWCVRMTGSMVAKHRAQVKDTPLRGDERGDLRCRV
jgi:hypothetical protein